MIFQIVFSAAAGGTGVGILVLAKNQNSSGITQTLSGDSPHVSTESKEEDKGGDSVKDEDNDEKMKENSEDDIGGSGKKRKREEEETAGSIEDTSNDRIVDTATEEDIKADDVTEGAVVSTGETVSTGVAESEEDNKMGVEEPSSSAIITQEESLEITVKSGDDQKDENKMGQKDADKSKLIISKIAPVSTVRVVPQRHLYTERSVRALDVQSCLICIRVLKRRFTFHAPLFLSISSCSFSIALLFYCLSLLLSSSVSLYLSISISPPFPLHPSQAC